MPKKRLKVVVIGGGTGTATVLSSLAADQNLVLTAIVTVADSGGSTGRLRDEFGFIPVGDIRQCLAALATGDNAQAIKDLLLYRFDRGEGLQTHNLGNLILTALTDLYGTPGVAIDTLSRVLRLCGQVFPVSETPGDLVIDLDDGSRLTGENCLNFPLPSGRHITKLSLAAPLAIYPPAAQAMQNADLLLFGPGDLYASLLPNTLVDGFREALATSRAPFVYLANLMTSNTQTAQLTARDHVRQVTHYAGRQPDIVVINNAPIVDTQLIANYQKEGLSPLLDDLQDVPYQVKRAPLVSPVTAKKVKADSLPRSFLRHHSQNLHLVIKEICHETVQSYTS